MTNEREHIPPMRGETAHEWGTRDGNVSATSASNLVFVFSDPFLSPLRSLFALFGGQSFFEN